LIWNTLDVMHYEQNFVKNVLKTITGEKDDVKVWHDLQGKGIKPQLWLTTNLRRGGKMLKPAIGFVLSTIEFDSFATTIEKLKTPLGHVSNMAKCIRRKIFGGLMLHGYHILMQQILPLALKSLLVLGLCMVVKRVFKNFKRICSKIWNPSEFELVQTNVAITLALVEMNFPPSFSNIMK